MENSRANGVIYPDANVITYMGGELFADLKGTAQIEHVFTEFTQKFSQMAHINGQFMLTQLSDNAAAATHYCTVKLVRVEKGKTQLQEHIVRYQDEYQKQQGKWRISKRVAHFMLSEQRELVG